MKNKQILGALALDLKRAALGYFRGSTVMADTFYREALKRKKELDENDLKPYVKKFLNNLDSIGREEKIKAAEDALLFSTVFQNAAVS